MDRTHALSAPSGGFNVPWRIRDAVVTVVIADLALIGLMLAFCLAFGIWLGLDFSLRGEELALDGDWADQMFEQALTAPPWFDGWMLIQSLLMVLLMSVWIFRPHAVSYRAFVLPGRGAIDARYAVRLLLVCLVVSVGAILAIIGLIAAGAFLLGRSPEQPINSYFAGLEGETKAVLTPDMGWLRVVLAVVVGPPIEELLYRGCLYAALRKRLKPWSSNLISSGLFALSHYYVFSLPNILIAGILAAYAYERTRSLRAPILFHVLWNTYCAAFSKPVLWVVLVAALGGLMLWARRAPKTLPVAAGASTQPVVGRRVGWKVYAWCFVVLSLLGYLADVSEAWEALVELPAYLAVLAYAYRRRSVPRRWWLAYGLLYVPWVVVQVAEATSPTSLAMVAQKLVSEGLSVEWLGPTALLLLGLAALFVVPSVVVLWRLARGR